MIHLWNGGPEEAWLAIQLKSGVPRVEELKEKLREVFARELPELRVSFEPSDIVSRVMSFGSSTPIEVAVNGPDLAVSREYAEKIYAKLKTIAALRDVHFAQSLDFPTVNVELNRERAGLLGVKTSDVTRSLVAATTSSRFTLPNYWADPKTGVSYNLQVQIPQAKTASIEDLKNVPVGANACSCAISRRSLLAPPSASTSDTTWRALSASPQTSTVPISATSPPKCGARLPARRPRKPRSRCAARSCRWKICSAASAPASSSRSS